MKILQACPKFHHSVASGSTKVAYSITNELARRGQSVTVYASNMRDKYTKIKNSEIEKISNVRVYRFQSVGIVATREMKIFITPAIIQKLKSEIRSFDIIHIHEYRSFQNIIVHHFARKYGVPYVLQAHGSLSRIMAWRRLKWIYDVLFGYRLLRDASKVIALSQMEAEQYRAMGMPEEKIAIIPNGIDLSEYANLPPRGAFKKKFGMDEGEKIVLYVGRINESKGLDLLAQAFKIVSEIVSNVRLVVVGPDDGYAAEFSRLISDLRIEEKVLLTGFVDKSDKLAAFVDSDVFVTPLFSGFPVTFLEACLAGCPIVTTTDELDWIHNNVGYVTEYSSDSLGKATASLLQDEHINRKFRNNSKHTLKKFNISTITSQLENVYETVANQNF